MIKTIEKYEKELGSTGPYREFKKSESVLFVKCFPEAMNNWAVNELTIYGVPTTDSKILKFIHPDDPDKIWQDGQWVDIKWDDLGGIDNGNITAIPGLS